MKVDMRQVLKSFDQMVRDNGSEAQVMLRSGETGALKMTDVGRRTDDMTEGLQQNNLVMRCMAAAWDGVLPRGPEKGDQITVAGRRYAVEGARVAQFQNVKVGYVLRLKG